jgi:hypothetical protein
MKWNSGTLFDIYPLEYEKEEDYEHYQKERFRTG